VSHFDTLPTGRTSQKIPIRSDTQANLDGADDRRPTATQWWSGRWRHSRTRKPLTPCSGSTDFTGTTCGYQICSRIRHAIISDSSIPS